MEILNALAFFLGIFLTELLIPKKKYKLEEDLLFLFFLVLSSSLMLEMNLKLFGKTWAYYLFVGSTSDIFSNFLVSLSIFLKKKLKHWKRKGMVKKIEKMKKKLPEELRKIGWEKEKIERFMKKVFGGEYVQGDH